MRQLATQDQPRLEQLFGRPLGLGAMRLKIGIRTKAKAVTDT